VRPWPPTGGSRPSYLCCSRLDASSVGRAGQLLLARRSTGQDWLGAGTRPTKDLDLLGFGDTSAKALEQIFTSVGNVSAPEDGLTFIADSVQVEPIRRGAGIRRYARDVDRAAREGPDRSSGGRRRPRPVVPPAESVDSPGFLELPRARVRAYRPETSIAEKTEAMVRLGLANSRMKDYFDIGTLAGAHRFDGETLRLSIHATFSRRKTAIPVVPPAALTDEFGNDRQKQQQWNAFVRRIRGAPAVGLLEVVESLRAFLWPVLQHAESDTPWRATWEPGGPWKP
jgi:hypothetical protein